MAKKKQNKNKSNKTTANGGGVRRNNNNKTVQFSPQVQQRQFIVHRQINNNDDDSDSDDSNNHRKRKKDKDVDDDDDIFDPTVLAGDDDDDAGNDGEEDIPSERRTLHAKRARRLKGMDDDDDDGVIEETNIDERTSLLAQEETDVPIEAFHMKEEETSGEGYFDGDTYVFRRGRRNNDDDDGGEPDAWLDSLKELRDEPIARTRVVKPASSSTISRSGVTPMDDMTKEELYAKLVPLVSDSETILQALTRYGNLLKRKRRTGKQQQQRQQQQPIDDDDEGRTRAQESLNQITEATNALLFKGELDIYQQTRAVILSRLHPPQEQQSSSSSSSKDTQQQQQQRKGRAVVVVQWEYQGNQDGQVHGPYSTSDMLGWTRSGYFIGEQAVQIRTIERIQKETTPKKNKSTQEELLDDLMDDDEEGATAETSTEIVKGEWQSSNNVDFTKYE